MPEDGARLFALARQDTGGLGEVAFGGRDDDPVRAAFAPSLRGARHPDAHVAGEHDRGVHGARRVGVHQPHARLTECAGGGRDRDQERGATRDPAPPNVCRRCVHAPRIITVPRIGCSRAPRDVAFPSEAHGIATLTDGARNKLGRCDPYDPGHNLIV